MGRGGVWLGCGHRARLAGGSESRIKLGSAIFQMPARSPAMTAVTAATIDQLSGRRMVLGIGPSGPQVAEGWHGQSFARQLQRTREYAAVVRMALAGERVEYHGETIELPLPNGPGKPLKLTISPVQQRIPAIGPRNTALAGEIADGWLPTFFSPSNVAVLRAPLEEGARRVGRTLNGFDITPSVNAYEGKKEEAAAALSDDLIDTVSLCGHGDVVGDRIAAFGEAGVRTLTITSLAFGADDRIAQLRAIAEIAG